MGISHWERKELLLELTESTFYDICCKKCKTVGELTYVKVSGDSKGLSFCLKKIILRLWAAQNRLPSNQIPVTHNTNGFQVWSRHTAPPGGQEVQNVSF